MAGKRLTGYEHVGSCSDRGLRRFNESYARDVARRVEEAKRSERREMVKSQNIILHFPAGDSVEERIERLFGRVCFYSGGRKSSSLEYHVPLHPKNVNPKDKKQVERCIKDQIDYAKSLERGPTSPFSHPLVIRTHRE